MNKKYEPWQLYEFMKDNGWVSATVGSEKGIHNCWAKGETWILDDIATELWKAGTLEKTLKEIENKNKSS